MIKKQFWPIAKENGYLQGSSPCLSTNKKGATLKRKKTRAKKEANREGANSKYAKKKRLQKRGVFSLTSPFRPAKESK